MFQISLAKNPEFGLCIKPDGDKDGGEVHMWSGGWVSPPDIFHQWVIMPDGSIRCAKNPGIGLCIKPEGDSDGGEVQMFEGGTSPPDIFHQWEVRPDGFIRCKKNPRKGLCIKPDGDRDGGEVHMWDCGDGEPGECHKWLITPYIGLCTIRSAVNQSFGLAIKLDGDKDGGELHVWTRSPDGNQDIHHHWQVVRDGSGNNTLRCAKNPAIGLAIKMDGAADGGGVHMWGPGTDDPGADIHHQWQIRPDGSIRCASSPNIGLCLKLGGDTDGGEVHMWDCGPGQLPGEQDAFHTWIIEPVGGCVPSVSGSGGY